MTARAASACAKRPPPISRASLPVSQTSAAPAIAGNNRKPKQRTHQKRWRANHAIRRDEWRLVYIAPIKMLGAGEVIKLIAKDSITTGGEKM